MDITGDASELCERVKEHVDENDGNIPAPPDILSDTKIIEYICVSFGSIFSNGLSAEVSDKEIKEVDQSIQISLSYVDKLDEKIRASMSAKNNAVYCIYHRYTIIVHRIEMKGILKLLESYK